MRTSTRVAWVCALVGAGWFLLVESMAFDAPSVAGTDEPTLRGRALHALRSLPVAFVANLGQWQEASRFVARRGSMAMHAFADSFGVVLAKGGDAPRAQATALRFWFEASLATTRIEGREAVPTRFHYLLGDDPSRWRADVTGYQKLWYSGLYPGIDLALRGSDAGFEYDFFLAPGAHLDDVVVRVDGAGAPLRLDADGGLVVTTRFGALRQPQPHAFEETERGPRPVACAYEILGQDRFRFRAEAVGPTAALVIDPQLQYSTYLGGTSWDEVFALALDASGEVVLAGRTFSFDFPTVNALQATLAGTSDAFVVRLDLAGGPPVYATYLGGSADDEARALALDANGGPLLVGATHSADFPTLNAFQPANAGLADTFVTRLSPSGGALVTSTYLGGNGVDAALGLALDASGGAVLAGGTASTDFPTRHALQASNGGGYDAFVARMPLGGGAPTYATYLGGGNDDGAVALALDAGGAAVVAGWTSSPDFPTRNAFQPTLAGATDAFLARLALTGGPPTLSTYVGGSAADFAYALALDASGCAVVAGGTSSPDFPTRGAFQAGLAGSSDAFVTRLPLSGAPPVASTYLGGTSTETALAVALDASGAAVVSGWTFSADFPLQDAWQANPAGVADVFLTRLPPVGGPPTFSTYLGGNGLDKPYAVAVDARDAVVVVGLTDSTNFPTRNALQPSLAGYFDVFVTRLDLLPLGARAYGTATRGCAGAPVIGASSSPRVGNSTFAVTCARAPANASGLLALSSGRLSTPLVFVGAAVWVDPFASAFVLLFANTDAGGAARVPIPLPANPGLIGASVFAQFLWSDACAGGGVSAANGLEVIVQP